MMALMSEPIMPAEIDYQLEQLLMRWWRYECGYRGWPRGAKASTIYGSRLGSSRVYDTANEILAEDVNHVEMDGVTGAIASLEREHREAVEFKMMVFTSPHAVWKSNRLGDRVEWLYIEAKVRLLPLLRRRRVEI